MLMINYMIHRADRSDQGQYGGREDSHTMSDGPIEQTVQIKGNMRFA